MPMQHHPVSRGRGAPLALPSHTVGRAEPAARPAPAEPTPVDPQRYTNRPYGNIL